ncbi:unnamed protein product [Acanthosepion pharaonis]|uniref:Uncharacterized protein n=1 Tax=Acanthosepion pharaonis TaxID=158019 RepID=A0A812EAC0_ACAPH|nr:unnamed protein product [Sepia pharaonis]
MFASFLFLYFFNLFCLLFFVTILSLIKLFPSYFFICSASDFFLFFLVFLITSLFFLVFFIIYFLCKFLDYYIKSFSFLHLSPLFFLKLIFFHFLELLCLLFFILFFLIILTNFLTLSRSSLSFFPLSFSLPLSLQYFPFFTIFSSLFDFRLSYSPLFTHYFIFHLFYFSLHSEHFRLGRGPFSCSIAAGKKSTTSQENRPDILSLGSIKGTTLARVSKNESQSRWRSSTLVMLGRPLLNKEAAWCSVVSAANNLYCVHNHLLCVPEDFFLLLLFYFLLSSISSTYTELVYLLPASLSFHFILHLLLLCFHLA